MYTRFLIVFLLLIIATVLVWTLGIKKSINFSTAPHSQVIIEIREDMFSPDPIEIKKWTKVIFKNTGTVVHWPASNLHPTHGVYPEFDPQEPIKPGEEWSFMFDKVGTWKYHDHLNPEITGEIIVTE